MKRYLVTWEIDIEAENEVEAAKMARKYQLDPESIATVFTVIGESYVVDLEELKGLDETVENKE